MRIQATMSSGTKMTAVMMTGHMSQAYADRPAQREPALIGRLRAAWLCLGRALEEPDEFAGGVVAMERVAEREVAVDVVLVAASDAGLGQIAGVLELADDLRHRSFGDADGGGDVSHAYAGVGGDARQHMPVVGDEPPGAVVIWRT
jgi:hypothetical protein